ncbi:hypothetical protein BBD42_25815 [Paenibacillus sp. BIHB 4019]|uniref:AraC family transcriptional regulator n=1 Tax=Paenibacillus sp. BIHB 4019 TaxID=1870819 RepID=A0A1B2DP89_9BACL|nr:AraC family transcriptional regulator [Paenibacillus sp. BIHB 4019]ANY69521.1 hypothetical protein BBD42_25815 [Paenibacillus sp. BIHB 4019]
MSRTDIFPVTKHSLRAVQETIAYLERAYSQNITIEQLAKQANIGSWQYRQLFRRITGFNPNEFVTELRMKRAKELLIVSQQRLSEIARTVGYEDEYYFNRRFKKSTGMSPRQYMRSKKSNLRIIALSNFGDMMALGSQPLAVDHHLINWLDQEQISGMASIDGSLSGVERAAVLKPDLIVVNAYTPQELLAELSHIAPAVHLESKGSMFQHLNEVAVLLGKRQEEKLWLDRYAAKARQIREQWLPTIGREETAIFFHVVGEQLYLYRPQEMPVIYEVLGFKTPLKLKQLMAECEARLFVPLESFLEYDADRIFIVCGQMQGARETFEKLLAHPEWRQLTAVQSGRVYIFKESWTLDGIIALEWQLDGISELLAGGQR